MRRRHALVGLALLAAVPARAQTVSPDLARGLFGEKEPEPGDEEEAAGQVEPPAPPAATPVPSPEAHSPEVYDTRVRQSFAAAEAFRGRLDGGWIAGARGRDLVLLQLSDRGDGRVEGAWRDLLAPFTPAASGLIDEVAAAGDGLEMRFGAPGGPAFDLALKLAADGRWTGRLRRGGELFDVVLRRTP